VNDNSLTQKLGEPLQVSQSFSQSSSSMNINGKSKSTTRVQATFQVVGPYGSGVATMIRVMGKFNPW
jgi:ABC-type polar amino acid transport system ATPase subunit